MLNCVKFRFLRVAFIPCFCFCFLAMGPHAFGQPANEREQLRTSTNERSWRELLEAISERDGNHFDLIFAYGGQGGGPAEAVSWSGSIKADPRMQKIYRELRRMPRKEAEAIVRDAFRSKLEVVQKQGYSVVGHYGLNATLFLLAQFGDDDAFNEAFETWLTWAKSESDRLIEQARERKAKAAKKGETYSGVGEYAWRYLIPELPVYLDCVANRRIRNGATPEEVAEELHAALARAGAVVKMDAIRRVLLPNNGLTAGVGSEDPGDDGSSWNELIHFRNWIGSTDILQYPERVVALFRLKYLVDPPTVAERIEVELLQKGVDDQRKKTARARDAFLERQKKANRPLKSGVRLRFIRGGRGGFKIDGIGVWVEQCKIWPKGSLPNKAEWAATMKTLFEDTPDAIRDHWQQAYTEAIDWADSLGDRGLAVDGRRMFRWPNPDKENMNGGDAQDDKRQHEYGIDFEIIEGELLKGPMPSDVDLEEDK